MTPTPQVELTKEQRIVILAQGHAYAAMGALWLEDIPQAQNWVQNVIDTLETRFPTPELESASSTDNWRKRALEAEAAVYAMVVHGIDCDCSMCLETLPTRLEAQRVAHGN